LPKVVTQQRRGRASNPRLLDRKSDALPLSHLRVVENLPQAAKYWIMSTTRSKTRSVAAGFGRHGMPPPTSNDTGTALGKDGSD